MGKPYSIDLRERVVAAVVKGGPAIEVVLFDFDGRILGTAN